MLMERAQLPSSQIATIARPPISAVVVELQPGVDPTVVLDALSGWADISVFTKDEQKDLLLRGVTDRARRQYRLFRIILIIVSAVIMALMIYTLCLEKIRDIAMLKLIGARNSVILSLILQQAVLLGLLGYIFALFLDTGYSQFSPGK